MNCENCKKYEDCKSGSGLTWPCSAYRPKGENKNPDFIKITRCKDCQHFKEAKVNSKGFLICPASGMEITENDYCSYAEKENK